MKMCMDHWNELKKAIEDRGLMSLVAPDGETATKNMVEELEGRGDLSTYDPLMDANNMIFSNALKCGGLYLLEGDICPLCEAEKHLGEGTAVDWIKNSTDGALKYCQDNKLVPGIQ